MNFSLKNVGKRQNRLAEHKAAEARKRAREDERMNELLRDGFGELDAAGDGVTFVRGGVTTHGETSTVEDAALRVGDVYEPKDLTSKKTRVGRALEATPPASVKDGDDAREEGRRGEGKRKVRALDTMLEEFAARDAARRARADDAGEKPATGYRPAVAGGSAPSTNIRVTPLPPEVTESDVADAFDMYGPIASVKIWLPRDGTSTQNSGYVCFMSRTSAERAVAEMHDSQLFGSVIDVEISKPLRLPLCHAWPLDVDSVEAERVLNSVVVDVLHERVVPALAATDETSHMPDVVVTIPEDESLRRRIDIVATYVVEDGREFEEALKTRERDNPEFEFLFDATSEARAYYVWRVFAFAQGDGLASWRETPFIMSVDGPRWVPPPAPKDKPEINKLLRASKASTKLIAKDRELLMDILRRLTVKREDIQDAMEFAVERSECSADVVDVITASLLVDDTPRRLKIARLYVVSDLLHNCGAPVKGVQSYRSHFIRTLPYVFAHLENYLSSLASKNAREAFKRDVQSVLAAWKSWSMFADEFIQGLEYTFLCGDVRELTLTRADAERIKRKLADVPDEACRAECRARGLVSDDDDDYRARLERLEQSLVYHGANA
jgi:U2-associated protein SR140